MSQSSQKARGPAYPRRYLSLRGRQGAIKQRPPAPSQPISGSAPDMSPRSEVEKLLGPGSERGGMMPDANLAARRPATLEQYLSGSAESLLSGAPLLESFYKDLQAPHVESPIPGVTPDIRRTYSARTHRLIEASIPALEWRPLSSIRRPISREREIRWLAENRNKYAGQWVVVEGDRLVASGPDSREVFQAAKQAGIEIPFLVQVEPEKQLPFGGW